MRSGGKRNGSPQLMRSGGKPQGPPQVQDIQERMCGVGADDQHASAGVGGGDRPRGGTGRLADAALATDEVIVRRYSSSQARASTPVTFTSGDETDGRASSRTSRSHARSSR